MSFRAEVDGDAFRSFQRDLRALDKKLANQLNRRLREVVTTDIIPTAQSNAGWSSRIPGAIKPKVTQRWVGARVDRKRAPHGRPYEGLQTGMRSRGVFRHPVFGNRKVWVSQKTRPFLAPAFDANRETAAEAAKQAITDAAREVGFN